MQAVGFATYTHSLMCGAELQIRHEEQSETLPSTYFIIEKLTLMGWLSGIVELCLIVIQHTSLLEYSAYLFKLPCQVGFTHSCVSGAELQIRHEENRRKRGCNGGTRGKEKHHREEREREREREEIAIP